MRVRKTDSCSALRLSWYLLIQELQVRGVITAFSQQPNDGSIATTGLILESLDAEAPGKWILIGRGQKKEAKISCSWCIRTWQWKVDVVSVKLALC